ncbi:MAG: SDR family oxidoreductase [Gammaproteobacteria bacterium]|nr:SDR family oxidoreductase [Gammaproteobacteria bacterium]
MGRLDGKIAVVTGATSGIGEATVDAFCNEGAKVVFCGRNETLGQEVQNRQPKDSAVFVQADVLHEEEIARVIQTAVDKWGRLDVLFNNAGGPSSPPGRRHAFNIEDIDEESFKYSQWYLLGSIMIATKYASPIMRKQGSGSIINNSSKGAHQAEVAADPLYSAAKAGVSNYTKAAAMQLGPMGIRVNAVSPGAIATPIFWGGHTHGQSITSEHKEARLAKFVRNVNSGVLPLKGPGGEAWDIAMACVYLGSDEGRWVTGIDLVVDGGMLAVKGDHVGTANQMREMWEKHDAAVVSNS